VANFSNINPTLASSPTTFPIRNRDALPAELKWHFKCPPSSFRTIVAAFAKCCTLSHINAEVNTEVVAIKNYPLFKGDAKVRENENWKNFATEYFACFSTTCE